MNAVGRPITYPPPKRHSGFVQRVITAAAFVAVMLASVYAGAISFTIIFGLVTILCLWEMLCIFFPRHDWGYRIMGLTLGVVPYAITISTNFDWASFDTLQVFWCMTAVLFLWFVIEMYQNSAKPFENIALLILSAVYVGVPFAILHDIGFLNETYNYEIIIGLMLMTWCSDTGAYMVGSQLGKTPLFSRISPKKTWEGTFGGVLATLLTGWGLSGLFPILPLQDWLALALIVSIFGPIGDLVESMLKRSHQVKDSSNLLPGHGGALDRFDAFLFALPFVAVYLFILR
ncbi:MAG: phosphatidate cytidylyltransferase [Bacteroidota bacterium]